MPLPPFIFHPTSPASHAAMTRPAATCVQLFLTMTWRVTFVSYRFLSALVAGVPVTVFYRFEREKLALAWREWMTKRVMEVGLNGTLKRIPNEPPSVPSPPESVRLVVQRLGYIIVQWSEVT